MKMEKETGKIKQRLTREFLKVTLLTSVAAVVACIAILVMGSRYDHALKYYGFSQGDIGKAMTVFADARSALRGAIGYENRDRVDELIVTYEEKKEAFGNYVEAIEDIIVTDEGREIYDRILADADAYWKLSDEVLDQGKSSDAEISERAQERMFTDVAPAYEKMYGDLADLMDLNVEKGDAVQRGLFILMFVVIAAIILIIGVVISISMKIGGNIAKGIAEPLGQLSKRLLTFSEGDLDSDFPVVETKDEIADIISAAGAMAEHLRVLIGDLSDLLGEMADGNFRIRTKVEESYAGNFKTLLLSIRKMNRSMSDTLREIEAASEQVSAGSGNMAEGAQALAEGATDQAGSIEELQATFMTITEAVGKTADGVDNAYQQLRVCAKDANQSSEEMQIMGQAMLRINEMAQKIANIVSEIESIASQTNLLSLNASIEAARAGEAGRGFAVVAEEIRQLAEQSAQSAVNTRDLIEGALHEVSEGNKAAENVSASISGVVEKMNALAESASELSVIAKEQAQTMAQAEEGVNQIAEVVQSNSATAEETSATSEELSAQAVSLNELVARFQLRED